MLIEFHSVCKMLFWLLLLWRWCFQELNLCTITPGSWPEFILVASAQTLQISILRKCGTPAAKLVNNNNSWHKSSCLLCSKKRSQCVSTLKWLHSFGIQRVFDRQTGVTGTASFLSLAFSCVKFPDCWGMDGPERRAVSSEWQLWIRSEAQFYESGWEKIWPRDATQAGQL